MGSVPLLQAGEAHYSYDELGRFGYASDREGRLVSYPIVRKAPSGSTAKASMSGRW